MATPAQAPRPRFTNPERNLRTVVDFDGVSSDWELSGTSRSRKKRQKTDYSSEHAMLESSEDSKRGSEHRRPSSKTTRELSRHALEARDEKEQGIWKKHKSKIIGAVAGTAAAITTAVVLTHSSDSEPKTIHLNDDGSVTTSQGGESLTADANGDGHVSKSELMDLKDPSDARFVPVSELVTALGPDFDQWRQDELNILLSGGRTNSEQAAVLSADIPSGSKENWSDQQVLNAISIDIADATSQDTKQGGRVMLPAVLNPRNPGYEDVYNSIEGGAHAFANLLVYKANGNKYPKLGNEFMGISDLSDNARLIYGEYVPTGNGNDNEVTRQVVMLVDLEKGDGDSSQWQKLNYWNVNDTEFQNAAPKIG